MSVRKLLQLTNILVYLFMITVYYLAEGIPLGGYTTNEIAAMYPSILIPASITFKTWGIIYLLLGAFVIYQSKGLFQRRKSDYTFLYQVGWLFVISSLMNSAYLVAWHYQRIGLSLMIMALLLLTLTGIYLRLQINKKSVGKNEKRFVHLPFQVYLGLATIAIIVNGAAWLVSINWKGWGLPPVLWAIIVIILVALVTVAVLRRRRDTAYALVILWAYLGILIKRIQEGPQQYPGVMITTVLCMAVIVLMLNPIVKRNQPMTLNNSSITLH